MALPLAAAWPAVMDMVDNLEKRTTPTVPPPKFHTNRDNCGSAGPCLSFNYEDQYVDVTQGSGHEWQAPGPGDHRGQCPGLNAAANHNFLPRSGTPNIQQSKCMQSNMMTSRYLQKFSHRRFGSSLQHEPRFGTCARRHLYRPLRRPNHRKLVDWGFVPRCTGIVGQANGNSRYP